MIVLACLNATIMFFVQMFIAEKIPYREPRSYIDVFVTVFRIIKKGAVIKFIIFMLIRQFGGGLGGGPFIAYLITNVFIYFSYNFRNFQRVIWF